MNQKTENNILESKELEMLIMNGQLISEEWLENYEKEFNKIEKFKTKKY